MTVDAHRSSSRLPLAALDATDMLAALSRGEITAVGLLEEHLALLDSRGAEIGAVIAVAAERARAEAATVDARRAAGHPLGPLAGLPMTAKDAFDVAGLRTTVGRLSDAHTASNDAPAIARLRAADAIVFGKTNVPELLADHQSSNSDFGGTRNPWDPERTPGGSSGGSAAAVAAGFAAADLGSDQAGSIRKPAAWSGLFGHRPSVGIVSKRGHLPWPTDGLLEPPVSTVGPLARSARDLELLLGVIAGAAGPDARAWRLQLPPPRVERLGGTRVALWFDDDAAPLESASRSALEALAQRLEDAGCVISTVQDPPIAGASALALFQRLEAAEISRSLDDATWASVRRAAASADSTEAALAARRLTQSARSAWLDLEEQRRVAERWATLFERVDVVLAPAVSGVAPLHSDVPPDERRLVVDGVDLPAASTVSAWSRLTNLTRGPATVVPAGPEDGGVLPVGAQLLGAAFDDRTTVAVARLAQEAGVLDFAPPPRW